MTELTLTIEGDTHVIVKRRFAAAPEADASAGSDA